MYAICSQFTRSARPAFLSQCRSSSSVVRDLNKTNSYPSRHQVASAIYYFLAVILRFFGLVFCCGELLLCNDTLPRAHIAAPKYTQLEPISKVVWRVIAAIRQLSDKYIPDKSTCKDTKFHVGWVGPIRSHAVNKELLNLHPYPEPPNSS